MKRKASRVPLSCLLALIVLLPLSALSSPPSGGTPAAAQSTAAPPVGFGIEVAFYTPRFASAPVIRESLLAVNQTWGIYPSVRVHVFTPGEGGPGLLILKGEKDDLALAQDIASALDDLGAAPALIPVPLEFRRAAAVKDDLLALARLAGIPWGEEHFAVFPPAGSGELFFKGAEEEAEKVREIAARLDQPEHASLSDSGWGFLRLFRKDLFSHFLSVSAYAASALLLLLVHFLLVHLPVIGRVYERWFTLIWTKVLDNVRGRDFVYEVLKNLIHTAVLSAEGSARGEKPSPPPMSSADRKTRALAAARDLLRYRGFDTDDPQIRRLSESLVDAELAEGKSCLS
jgi:hypothetical protein